MSAIQTTDHRVASGENGLKVLVRNKRRAGAADGRSVLFIHGATYPSTVMFDYPVNGVSWMDWMAGRGHDCWCVDLPGYGGSERPAEMEGPAEASAPIVRTAMAERVVGRVIDFIRAERGIDRLSLVGYSWGSAIGGGVAATMSEKIDRLVLAGALWCRVGTAGIAVDGKLGAYRRVTADQIVSRWTLNLDEAQKAAIAPPERFRAWAEAAVATDPRSGESDLPSLRAPAGVVQDVADHWLRNDPTYEPGRITVPTLVVVGEWDQETTPEQGREVFTRLTAVPEKRYTVIGRGTHSLLLEEHRHALYQTVDGFLGT